MMPHRRILPDFCKPLSLFFKVSTEVLRPDQGEPKSHFPSVLFFAHVSKIHWL